MLKFFSPKLMKNVIMFYRLSKDNIPVVCEYCLMCSFLLAYSILPITGKVGQVNNFFKLI